MFAGELVRKVQEIFRAECSASGRRKTRKQLKIDDGEVENWPFRELVFLFFSCFVLFLFFIMSFLPCSCFLVLRCRWSFLCRCSSSLPVQQTTFNYHIGNHRVLYSERHRYAIIV